jgi:hypothetical protein
VVIASPIESLPQDLKGPDLSRDLSQGLSQGLWTGKKGKKNGAGLFSKLLSGLLKNPGRPLSGTVPEEVRAAEGGEPGAGPGKTPAGAPGRLSGERPGKTAGQKARAPGLARGEGASKAEGPAGDRAGKKPAGTRKGEDAGETRYLLSRAEIPAEKPRVPEDPEGSPVPEREGAEPGLEGAGALPGDPEASGPFPGEAYFSGSGPEFPGEERRAGSTGKAEDLSGLEGKLAGEFARLGETRSGPEGPGKTEKDEKRPAEARKTERRREKPAVVEARDLRGAQEAGVPGLKEEALPEGRSSGQEIDLSVELRHESRGSERASSGGEKTLSQAFEDILARELHQNLNGDIVRHASVVLRDGGEGLIRLSLKPDTLGNVKIRLEMAENKITGHIVVESDEALRAFEREIGSLEQAFKDSGFDAADLNMSLASGDSGADQRREAEQPFFSERFAVEQAASRYEALTEKTDVFATGLVNGLKPGNGRISVNLLV